MNQTSYLYCRQLDTMCQPDVSSWPSAYAHIRLESWLSLVFLASEETWHLFYCLAQCDQCGRWFNQNSWSLSLHSSAFVCSWAAANCIHARQYYAVGVLHGLWLFSKILHCTHLEKEKSNEVEKTTDHKWIVSHHFGHDNTRVHGVCSDIYVYRNKDT